MLSCILIVLLKIFISLNSGYSKQQN